MTTESETIPTWEPTPAQRALKEGDRVRVEAGGVGKDFETTLFRAPFRYDADSEWHAHVYFPDGLAYAVLLRHVTPLPPEEPAADAWPDGDHAPQEGEELDWLRQIKRWRWHGEGEFSADNVGRLLAAYDALRCKNGTQADTILRLIRERDEARQQAERARQERNAAQVTARREVAAELAEARQEAAMLREREAERAEEWERLTTRLAGADYERSVYEAWWRVAAEALDLAFKELAFIRASPEPAAPPCGDASEGSDEERQEWDAWLTGLKQSLNDGQGLEPHDALQLFAAYDAACAAGEHNGRELGRVAGILREERRARGCPPAPVSPIKCEECARLRQVIQDHWTAELAALQAEGAVRHAKEERAEAWGRLGAAKAALDREAAL